MLSNYGVDFGLVAIYLFWGFFAGLILYLRREDRREGYPLEDDGSRRLQPAGGAMFIADPKVFRLPFGQGDVFAPSEKRDDRALAYKRTSVTPGSPSVPTGNPLIDGIGPAGYADRAKRPELDAHGHPKIVPMRVAAGFSIAKGDPDPRGMEVLGLDGAVAGKVSDVWVDRPESYIRYLEVSLTSGGQPVLLPITGALINKGKRKVVVDAITAAQFADVPRLEKSDQITLYEEERVVAYYGGGYLYATASRQEPLL
jgi:photosynthetic reaction center H subunit